MCSLEDIWKMLSAWYKNVVNQLMSCFIICQVIFYQVSSCWRNVPTLLQQITFLHVGHNPRLSILWTSSFLTGGTL